LVAKDKENWVVSLYGQAIRAAPQQIRPATQEEVEATRALEPILRNFEDNPFDEKNYRIFQDITREEFPPESQGEAAPPPAAPSQEPAPAPAAAPEEEPGVGDEGPEETNEKGPVPKENPEVPNWVIQVLQGVRKTHWVEETDLGAYRDILPKTFKLDAVRISKAPKALLTPRPRVSSGGEHR